MGLVVNSASFFPSFFFSTSLYPSAPAGRHSLCTNSLLSTTVFPNMLRLTGYSYSAKLFRLSLAEIASRQDCRLGSAGDFLFAYISTQTSAIWWWSYVFIPMLDQAICSRYGCCYHAQSSWAVNIFVLQRGLPTQWTTYYWLCIMLFIRRSWHFCIRCFYRSFPKW